MNAFATWRTSSPEWSAVCQHEWCSGRLRLSPVRRLYVAELLCDGCGMVVCPLPAQTREARAMQSGVPVVVVRIPRP